MTLIPPDRREEIKGLMGRIGTAVGGFFRGQLLVALFVGVASSIGLWAIGQYPPCGVATNPDALAASWHS